MVCCPSIPDGAGAEAAPLPDEAEALDAYSRTVAGVVERLAPSVANLRVLRATRRGRVPAGAGSAVVLTPDGFLLTSAHVVSGRDRLGRASFVDGREIGFRVRRRRSAVRPRGAAQRRETTYSPAVLGDAARAARGTARRRDRQPHGFAGSVTAGVDLGARPLAARPLGRDDADDRQRDPDRRGAQPGQLRRRARRLLRPARRRQHRGRRRRASGSRCRSTRPRAR